MAPKKLSIAAVCLCNMNRSMEVHKNLAEKGFKIRSYGTSDMVRLPSVNKTPNVYKFGTPYVEMYNDLIKKNRTFYKETGLLNVLKRNQRIKPHPERFQDCTEEFDLIITLDKYVFDNVKEHFESHPRKTDHKVHIVNVEVEDSFEAAKKAAITVAEMVVILNKSKDLDQDILPILSTLALKTTEGFLHCVFYY